MIEMSIGQIAKIVGGEVIGIDPESKTCAYPVISSKEAGPGTFFAALKGSNTDGHNFVEEAIKSGSQFALVSSQVTGAAIKVSDVLEALATLATYVRQELKALKVIGITGSQGKTTTKDLLQHILQISGETTAPEGSLNNELGVPLLILRCTLATKYCIVEMGARRTGDISYLVGIAKPHIGVVLVVGSAHLGEFGSREKIAQTKAELIAGLASGGTAILGTYDEFTPNMEVPSGVERITFGENSRCNVRAADVEIREGRAHFDLVTRDGRAAVSLQLLGMHQIPNALAAAAVATALNISIDSISAALSTAEIKSKWRMQVEEINGITMINDSYNANPESMAAALRTVALISQETGGVSWAFLGKMNELGASSGREHAEIGQLVTKIGIDNLVSIGTRDYMTQLSEASDRGESAVHFFENRAAALALVEHFAVGDVVLIKASRSEEFNLLADLMREKLTEDLA
ncbi:MAG: UDP-N-acetylmuramoyl-tripeptide--D-alanyl-D-alanine ligase [SAR202 cluster bacterium]|nr:UDP-N-acetylmuramoyl-tripeptide--D-alanyl-D-alanine ligase [SAR202 cluster bacterium]